MSNSILHGNDAVRAAEGELGRPLNEIEREIVISEGYSAQPYRDHKGNLTVGVGQTGEWADKGFAATVNHHVQRAANRIPNFFELPKPVQAQLASAEYRGDLGGSPNFVQQFNSGNYEGAAQEFLNHDEYRESRQAGTGVAPRMEKVAQVVSQLGQEGQQAPQPATPSQPSTIDWDSELSQFDIDTPTDDRGEFRKGVVSALKSTGSGIKALYGTVTGDAGTQYDALTDMQRNQRENAPTVGRVEDIDGLGEFADWFAYNLGSGTTSIATMVAGGGIPGMAVKGLAKGALVNSARTLGGTAAGFSPNYGESLNNAYQETGSIESEAALASAAVKTALDFIVPAKVIKMGMGKEAIEHMSEKAKQQLINDRGFLTWAKETVKTQGAEAVTEGAQTYVDQVMNNILTGEDNAFGVRDWSEILNAGASGAAGATGFGVYSGVQRNKQASALRESSAQQNQAADQILNDTPAVTPPSLDDAVNSGESVDLTPTTPTNDLEIPAVARQAGVQSNTEPFGFSDDFVNNASMRQGNRSALQNPIVPVGEAGTWQPDFTLQDTPTGIQPHTFQGEWLPPEGAQPNSVPVGQVIESPVIDGETVPDTPLLPNGQTRIEDKNIVFAPDNRAVNLQVSGKPFGGKRAVGLSKGFKQAKASGLNPQVVPVNGGYGWVTENDNANVDTTSAAGPGDQPIRSAGAGQPDNARPAGQPGPGNATAPNESPRLQTTTVAGERGTNDNAVDPLNKPVEAAPVNELSLSDDIPQFKSGADQDGVVEKLTGKYDPVGMSPIQVWVRKDGKKEVITGRHRLDLAKRSGAQTIPAQYHYEADGFTAEDGKRTDAILNIRDDKGQVEDYVELFQQDQLTEDDAKELGLLDRAIGRTAYKIASSATSETIEAQRSGRITGQAAERLAEAAPKDQALQALGVKALVNDQRSIAFAENLIRAVSTMRQNNGQEQASGDLFGFDDSAMQQAEEMAKAAAAKQRQIKTRISAVKGAAKNPKLAAAEGVNVKDPDSLKNRISELDAQAKSWDNWHTNPALVNELRSELDMTPASTDTFGLETETEQQIRDREQAQAQVKAQQDAEAKANEDKAQADTELDDFRLSGSTQPADVATSYGQGDLLGASQPKPSKTEQPSQPVKETKPKAASKDEPAIVSMTKKQWVNKERIRQGIKKSSPGYDKAVQKIEDSYEQELDKAYAALPFERYNELNSDTPKAINEKAHQALQKEFGKVDDKPDQMPSVVETKDLESQIIATLQGKTIRDKSDAEAVVGQFFGSMDASNFYNDLPTIKERKHFPISYRMQKKAWDNVSKDRIVAALSKNGGRVKKPSKLDTTATKLGDKKKQAAAELAALIKKQKGTLNSGFNPEIMLAVAKLGGYAIAEGTVKFSQWVRDVLNFTRQANIPDAEVVPYLKEAYGAINYNPEKYDVTDDQADAMDSGRVVSKADLDKLTSESDDVSTTSGNVEPASQSANTKPKPTNADEAQPDAAKPATGSAKPATGQGVRTGSVPSVSNNDGAVSGTPSAEQVFDTDGTARPDPKAGDTGQSGRGSGDNDTGTPAELDAAPATTEAVKQLEQTGQTRPPATHAAKWGNEKDILASVPVLMPAQAGDIALIEQRFFGKENPGLGYQNTNGTGTGKTFVGLGAVKRMQQSGKENSLIVVPNDGIARQWVKAARDFFDMEITVLGSGSLSKTKDPGKGITITTYATLGQNNALINERDKYDLIITDESQNLMGSQQAKETRALRRLRAMTNHEQGRYERAKLKYADQQDALNQKIKDKLHQIMGRYDSMDAAEADAKDFYKEEQRALSDKIRAEQDRLGKDGQFDTKVLFLSATPWPYVKNLEYAEGYVFNYTDYGDKHEGGYDNAFHGHNAFYINNFGYRWRYHKLNTPGAEVDQSLMERMFHEKLKKQGVLGGRTLEVEADYNRDFIKVETAAGEKLDDLIDKWRNHEEAVDGEEYPDRPYSELAETLQKTFDYTKRIKLVEAIKAEEAVARGKDHLAMGRKIVIFHSYNVGGSFDPVSSVRAAHPELMQRFDAEFPGMSEIHFGNLERPLDLFAREFGDKVRFYNGTVNDKGRAEAKALFNQDDSGVDVLVVQQEAGEAGISLHDTTGKHQRVLLNIGIPVKPTQLIQIEGRTYRVGVMTDAQFELLTTGTGFERELFASRIAGRTSTAENLAMGEMARTLKENIAEGYLDAAYKPAQTKIGKGGKEKDRPGEIDEWDKAKTLYWANLKRTQGTKSAEGDDYFATPEPLGKKMVEWAQAKPGTRTLEPSIGHGAIGRWFGGTTRNKALEPSYRLFSLAQMSFAGDVINDRFESLNIINKFETVAMNPPFGEGGKLAYEHIQKALGHLTNGGRIVALVPDGPAANKRLDALLTSEKNANIYQAAEIDLPAGVFKRAGTGVKTKIIILDRFDDSADAPQQQNLSFTGVKDESELFDRIKDIELRERNEPTAKEIDPAKYLFDGRQSSSGFPVSLLGPVNGQIVTLLNNEAIDTIGGRKSRDGIKWVFESQEQRDDFKAFAAKTLSEAEESGVNLNFPKPMEKPPQVKGQTSNDHFDASGEVYTTKKGKEFQVTEMLERHDYDVYTKLKELAKELGGWARGQKFMFPSQDDVAQFNELGAKIIDGPDDSVRFNRSEKTVNGKPVTAKAAKVAFKDFINHYKGLDDDGFEQIITDKKPSEIFGPTVAKDDNHIKGAFDKATNRLFIFASNHQSIEDVRRTLREELLVHKGLGVFDKQEIDGLLRAINDTRSSTNKQFKRIWRDIDKNYAGKPPLVQAEEFLGKVAQHKPTLAGKYWNKIVTALTKLLRSMNLVKPGITPAEMKAVVYEIGASLQAGKPASNYGFVADDNVMVNGAMRSKNSDKGGRIHNTDKGVSNFWKWKLHGTDQSGAARSQSNISKDGFFFAGKWQAPDDSDRLLQLRDREVRGAAVRRYHGTRSDITQFNVDSKDKKDNGWLGKGIYVTPSIDVAETYSKYKKTGNAGQVLMPVYVRTANPVLADFSLKIHLSKKSKDYIEKWTQEKIKQGYDSVIMVADNKKEVAEIVVFSPGQIKSAIGNNGEFSPVSDDLRFNIDRSADLQQAKDKLGLGDKEPAGIAQSVKEAFSSVQSALQSGWRDRATEGLFDSLHGIKKAEEAAGISQEDQGYVTARLAAGVADVIHGVMFHGAPQWRDGIVQRKPDSKGLLEVLGQLDKKQLDDWLAWMAGNRANALMAQGRENNLTQAEIDELMTLNQGREALFNQIKDEYNQINAATLDLAQEAGLVDADVRAQFDSEWYVPFFREQEATDFDSMIKAPFSKAGVANQSSNIKRLRGGDMATNDILENILRRQATMIEAAMKNKAMSEIVTNLKDTDYLQDETLKYKPVVVPKGEIIKRIKADRNYMQDVADMLGITDKPDFDVIKEVAKLDSQGFEQLFAVTPPTDPDVVAVTINGRKKYYRVMEPALLRGLVQMSVKRSDHPLMKLSRAAKRMLTTGVTLSPEFILRNFIRDSVHGWMINKDGFKVGLDSVRGAVKTWKKDQSTIDLMFAGASFQSGYVSGTDPEAAANQIRRALDKKGLNKQEIDSYMKTLWNGSKKGFEKYRSISDGIENANRASTYEASLNAGKSKKIAAFEAKDFMDFGLQGNFKTMQWLVDVIPFLNARMQGMYKLYRAGKASSGDQMLKVLSKELTMKGMYVAGLSLALALKNMDDERYEELPDWDKDANWHFFMGDTHIRVPKPFELGIMFGTVPERLLMASTGKQNADDLRRSAAHAIVSTMSFNPIPQIIKPATEAFMNYDTFGMRPIDGFGDMRKRPEDRYSRYTSETAKALGGLFGYSPNKVEHLVRGYAGTFGSYMLAFSDMVANSAATATGNGEWKYNELDDLSVVRAFVKHDEVGSTYYRQQFYDTLKEIGGVYSQYKTATEERDLETAQEIMAEHKDELKYRTFFNRAARQMSQINNQSNMIWKNKDLSLKEREAKIDELTRRKNAIARRVILEYRAGG